RYHDLVAGGFGRQSDSSAFTREFDRVSDQVSDDLEDAPPIGADGRGVAFDLRAQRTTRPAVTWRGGSSSIDSAGRGPALAKNCNLVRSRSSTCRSRAISMATPTRSASIPTTNPQESLHRRMVLR